MKKKNLSDVNENSQANLQTWKSKNEGKVINKGKVQLFTIWG